MRALVALVLFSTSALAAPARPEIDLVDVAPPSDSPGRPWPLSELPSVQPNLDLAMAHDACTPEASKRARDDDVRAYLAAWCRYRAGERSAVDSIAALTHSGHEDVARAAMLDVVNLIADSEDHKAALTHLRRLQLVSTRTQDLLAATYLALGQHDDAFQVGREAMQDESNPADVAHCERRLAWSHLDEVGGAPRTPSEHRGRDACDRIRATACALERAAPGGLVRGPGYVAIRECFLELPDDPMREAKLAVILAFAAWPSKADAPSWISLARVAETGLQARGGELLAVTALEAAYEQTCDPAVLETIATAAKRIRGADAHDGAFERRLGDLAKAGAKRCP